MQGIILSFIMVLGLPIVCGYIAYKSKEHNFLEIIDKLIDGVEDFIEAEDLADEKGIGVIPENYELIIKKYVKCQKKKIDKELTNKERNLINERLGNKGYIKGGK